MGGKSVLLRVVGLCQWAAQCGLPVPARRCDFAPVAQITYVGSEEPGVRAAEEGLSSFGREIRRLVRHRDRDAHPVLWLLDEVGRGTHPLEGAAIAVDIIEALAERGDRLLVATHFPEVAAMHDVRRYRIAGLCGEDLPVASEPAQMSYGAWEEALRAAMDYRPVELDPAERAEIPRDARLVARLLGWETRSEE
jgi:hypothetical protein